MVRIAVYGPQGGYGGAGVVLDAIAGALDSVQPGVDVVRIVPESTPRSGPLRVASLLRPSSVVETRDLDALVVGASPFPRMSVRIPCINIVYDLRWRWSRGVMSRAYRRADLWRANHACMALMPISYTVQTQLGTLLRRPPGNYPVIRLGPGRAASHYGMQSPNSKCSEFGSRGAQVDPWRVVIAGRGAHKRNDLAISLLASSRFADRIHVVLLSVDHEVEEAAAQAQFGGGLTIRSSLDDPADYFGELERSAALVFLGESEGFGFSYLEAAAAGCPVICADVGIAREVLSDRGIFLASLGVESLDQCLSSREAWPDKSSLALRVSEFDWQHSAADLMRVLGEAVYA